MNDLNRKKSWKTTLLNAPYVVWSALFIIIPMVMVLFYALTETINYYDVRFVSDGIEYVYEIDCTDGTILSINQEKTEIPSSDGKSVDAISAVAIAQNHAGAEDDAGDVSVEQKSRTGKLTLSHLGDVWTPAIGRAFLLSLEYSLIATAIALVIAYPFAYFLSRTGAKSQRIQMLLIMLPMWMNMLIRTYSWMNILENNGLLNKLFALIGLGPFKMLGTGGAVVLGMVYNYLPYMILPIYTIMTKIDKSLLEAAEDLGCNAFQKLRRLILPLSVPGVISGIIMVFVPSISTFYISQKMSNGTIKLVGDLIETKIKEQWASGGLNVGASMALVLMIIIMLCTFIMNRFSDDDGGGNMPI